MTGNRKTLVFFRNDDVNRIEPGLVEVTELLVRHQATVAHAVEPANLAAETRDWLLARTDQGVEIIQHGYAHVRHDLGEFGGKRSRNEQQHDLEAGLQIMRASFGAAFLPFMSFPFGHYNEHTLSLLDELGYQVLSSHVRHQFKRQVFYALGRGLGRGRLFGRHVSYHLGRYPKTRLLEVSVTISPIRRYLRDEGPVACEFYSAGELKAIFERCRRLWPVVGVVLHHRFHDSPERRRHLEDFLVMLEADPAVEFATMADIVRRFA